MHSKRSYDATEEHNYFYDSNKKKCQWPDEKVNCTKKITNDNDKLDSSLEWFMEVSSSDEEEDFTDIPLTLLLKRELEKDLQRKCKNQKSPNNLNPMHEDQPNDELNNKN